MKADFGRKLRKFSNAVEKINVEKIFLQAIEETSELALDLNRVQMSELGVDSQNKPLGQYASSTKKVKQKKGQPSDHITLRDTGRFQDNLFIDTKQRPVMIESKDSKRDIIARRWPKALGLILQFLDQYSETTMALVRVKLNKEIETRAKILQ